MMDAVTTMDAYQTSPRWWRRVVNWLTRPAPPKEPEFPEGPRYRYVPGMEKPDARYHPIPGAVARAREEAARQALKGQK